MPRPLHGKAITSAIIFGLAVALLLGIALVATTIIGRSMVGPLRRLRNGALEVAGTWLPDYGPPDERDRRGRHPARG